MHEAGLTVRQALHDYTREHKVAAADRRYYAVKSLDELLGDRMLSTIDIPACREYMARRHPVKHSTVRRELGVLQAAANHALRWRRITAAEMPSIELPPSAEPKTLWLFDDELKRLRDAATGRAKLFIDLAYYTASRKGALEFLTWDRVDLAKRRIVLADPGGRSNKKRKPVVPMADELWDALAAYRGKWLPEVMYPHGAKPKVYKSGWSDEWVLGSNADIRPCFDAATSRALLEMLPARDGRPAGRLTPHVLRHTRATHLLQKGVAPYAVAALLGDTVQTVLRVYGHHCPNYLAEAIA